VTGPTIPSPPAPDLVDLLDAFAKDVSEQLTTVEDSVSALRQLAASMQREADRARQGRAP
jgi:hypothetical protein